MPPPEPRDRMMEVLDATHDAIVTEYVRQVRAANPLYAGMPLEPLTQATAALVDAGYASLRARDASVLTQFLNQTTRVRLQQGFSGESQIAAATLLEVLIRQTVRRELADAPAELAAAERRLDSLAATGRNAIGRILLSEMVPPPDKTRSSGDQS